MHDWSMGFPHTGQAFRGSHIFVGFSLHLLIYYTRQNQPDYQTSGQVSTRAVPVLRLVAPERALYLSLPQ